MSGANVRSVRIRCMSRKVTAYLVFFLHRLELVMCILRSYIYYCVQFIVYCSLKCIGILDITRVSIFCLWGGRICILAFCGRILLAQWTCAIGPRQQKSEPTLRLPVHNFVSQSPSPHSSLQVFQKSSKNSNARSESLLAQSTEL